MLRTAAAAGRAAWGQWEGLEGRDQAPTPARAAAAARQGQTAGSLELGLRCLGGTPSQGRCPRGGRGRTHRSRARDREVQWSRGSRTLVDTPNQRLRWARALRVYCSLSPQCALGRCGGTGKEESGVRAGALGSGLQLSHRLLRDTEQEES